MEMRGALVVPAGGGRVKYRKVGEGNLPDL